MALGSANAEDRGLIFPKPGSPPFDFSDAFYGENGINPLNVQGRVNGSDGVSVFDQAPDERHSDIRVIETTAGYDSSGAFLWYNIMGTLFADSFTADPAGSHAHAIANQFRALRPVGQ